MKPPSWRLPSWRTDAKGPSMWRWTVSHQILALVAVSILVAQAAGLVVLLTLPPRPPAPVAMDQAFVRIREVMRLVEAQKPSDAVRETRSASDRRLVFSIADGEPPAALDPFSERLSAFVAQRMGLDMDGVRVVDLGPRPRPPGQEVFAPPGPPPPAPSDTPAPDIAPLPDGAIPGVPGADGAGPDPGVGPAGGNPAALDPDRVDRALGRALSRERPPGFAQRFVQRFRGGDAQPRFRQGFRGRELLFPRGRRALAVKAGPHWLLVRSPPSSAESLWLRQVGLTFALTLAALLAPALWIAHRMALRIRGFAEAADRFGANPDAPQIPEQGPYELQQAAGAFNRMQARIRRLVSDRTMMMAAVSHDLRTPLARVRFRIADLDPAARDSISEDIRQMDELITQMLSFTRDALPGAERRKFDLSALAQSLVDDMADEGRDVSFEGPDKLTVEANLAAVRRVLSNLLDNALKYAGHAKVILQPAGDCALAIVEDAGPGVPPGMEDAIFEPFRRLEPSRNRKTGGVGLGLAIARNLARGHGGDVVLERAPGGGARFVFSLPLH